MKKEQRLKKDAEEQEQKIASYLDRIKQQKNHTNPKNSEQTSDSEIHKVNPYFRQIDRHYGSFKTKLLGNQLKIFNSLKFKEIKPLGKHGTGSRRKLWSTPEFTALFYSNGTIEIKPTRKKGLHPDKLQEDFFQKARGCCSLLKKRGYLTIPLKMNRSPKYGYKDKTASFVKKEYKGKDRGMDATPDPNSIDNFSCAATKRDIRVSDDKHFEIAKARANNPEVLASIEDKLAAVADASALLGKNMETHVSIMRGIDSGLKDFGKAVKALGPRRHRFPSSFRRSATIKGVS